MLVNGDSTSGFDTVFLYLGEDFLHDIFADEVSAYRYHAPVKIRLPRLTQDPAEARARWEWMMIGGSNLVQCSCLPPHHSPII